MFLYKYFLVIFIVMYVSEQIEENWLTLYKTNLYDKNKLSISTSNHWAVPWTFKNKTFFF